MTDILDELGIRQPESAAVKTVPDDARFVLACCCIWVPENNTKHLAQFTELDFEQEPILQLLTKVIPVYLDGDAEIVYTIGEIAYILHYLRGEDSYGGGKTFQDALVKTLQQLLRGGE